MLLTISFDDFYSIVNEENAYKTQNIIFEKLELKNMLHFNREWNAYLLKHSISVFLIRRKKFKKKSQTFSII